MSSSIEKMLIEGNLRYYLKITQESESVEISGKLPRYPVLILTCMDPRIDVHRIFQLNPGDVFILRNAGNIFSPDMLRSIVLAIYQYNIQYIIILGHLDCGMTKINLLELKKKISYKVLPHKPTRTTDIFEEIKDFFKPFHDELKNVKQQLKNLSKLQIHNPELKVIGMLYDVATGWVFEYEKFKEFASIENFKTDYKALIQEKKLQFIDYIETIEDEIIINTEYNEEWKMENDSDEERELSIEEGLAEKDQIPIEVQNEILRTSSVLTKIQIPKINFPGIKIYIPKIYRKKIISKD